MRVSSTFVSLLLCLLWFSPCNSQELKQYQLLMQARGHEITGICMMETAEDGNMVGTVVNEFGVKAFDFTYRDGKAKILNAIGPINKWYIRKVLRGDFNFILKNLPTRQDAKKGKRRLTFKSNGDISVSNDRYKIYYTFTPCD